VLAALVLLYLAVSLGVGLYAATRVRGASDFALAGKRFGSAIVAATVFATWFGAETVLGIGATFLKEGLRGLVADPFGAVGCLILIGLVFARPLYRLDVLTLGDYFRQRYGRPTEIALSLTIAFSYFGWVAAQLVALGLAMNVISHGAIDTRTGIVIGAAVVLAYTMAGGMWSVALTDFFQALVIIAGMLYVAWAVAGLAGGVDRVWQAAAADERMRFLPAADARSILGWVSAALVVVLGSVPQQDVLQRIKSARDENGAVRATIVGGLVYLAIAMVPDVPRGRGGGDRSADGRAPDARGLPAHPADADARAHAARGAGVLLRRPAVRDPFHGRRRAARPRPSCSPRTSSARS
jgi:Na+/proline symporter